MDRNKLLTFGPAALIIFIQYIWKLVYQFGVPGIYWLFVFLDKYYFYTLGITFGLSIVLLLISFLWNKSTDTHKIIFNIFLSLLFSSIAIVCTFLITFTQHMVHLESLRVKNHVYHVVDYRMFDSNFGVAECGPVGIICKQIFRSGDFSTFTAELDYRSEINRVILSVPRHGIIFNHIVD